MALENRWFENDQFWQEMERKVYSADQWNASMQEVEQALRLLKISEPSMLLDMCCGNGRHSIALSRLGHEVMGVDLNDRYLAAAVAAANREGAQVEFQKGDMRVFQSTQLFDAALVLWNAFGYFETDVEDGQALARLNSSLRPGGKLLLQTHGRESTARKFVRKDWFEIGDCLVLDQRWIEDNWERMRTRYIVIDENGRREHVMSCRLYSPGSIGLLLKSAGFAHIEFFGSLSGTPYDEKAFELVAVATKT